MNLNKWLICPCIKQDVTIPTRVYFKRGVPPRSDEISAKTRNVGPLKYTLIPTRLYFKRGGYPPNDQIQQTHKLLTINLL